MLNYPKVQLGHNILGPTDFRTQSTAMYHAPDLSMTVT